MKTLILHIFILISVFSISAYEFEDVMPEGRIRRQAHTVDSGRVPTNVQIEAGEETITLHWAPPANRNEATGCMVEYKADNNPFSIRIPVSKTEQIYVIGHLNRNTLYEVRLYCLYGDGNSVGPYTEWFGVSTRTVSVEPSVCAGSLPNAFLQPMCLKFPDENFCLITTCKPGFQMTNILGVTYGYRNRNARPVYVLCRNGTWVTNHEERHFGIKDICLPEAEFQKCPLSIPNGNLERHCGPSTDWLCNFECNEGYHAHAYMSGILKNFFDYPDMLYCDNGIWKTGYEDLGVDVAGVCVPEEHNCTNSDDIPHGRVLYLPCPSGYGCGLECDPGYHKHALAWDDPSCENGVWVLRTTKHDASITPLNVCVQDDSVGVCPRNFHHGRLRDPACTRKCWPDCDEGYHMPMRVPAMRLSCEGGKWFTSEAPYNADNVCFPEGGHVCPYEIPNGVMSERENRRADDGRFRSYMSVTCNDGFREDRTMRWLECIAGEWVTDQERFGLDTSKICIPYTP